MSHELEMNDDGTANFVSGRGRTAWHGLGVTCEGLMSVDEALQKAGLNWTVEKRPIFSQVFEPAADGGEPVSVFQQVPNRFANVRSTDQKVLAVVGSSYEPVQNRDGFELLQALLDTGEAVLDTAGSLFEGKRVFASALMPDKLKLAGEDYEVYLLFTNSHDGSKGVSVSIVTVRVVCRNTEQMALAGAKHTWSAAHRGNIKDKMDAVVETLDLKNRYLAAFNAEVGRMIQTELDKETFKKILMASFPDQKVQRELNVATVLDILEVSETIPDETRGTAFGGYQAITEFTSHKVYKNDEAKMKGVLGWHQRTRDLVASGLRQL